MMSRLFSLQLFKLCPQHLSERRDRSFVTRSAQILHNLRHTGEFRYWKMTRVSQKTVRRSEVDVYRAGLLFICKLHRFCFHRRRLLRVSQSARDTNWTYSHEVWCADRCSWLHLGCFHPDFGGISPQVTCFIVITRRTACWLILVYSLDSESRVFYFTCSELGLISDRLLQRLWNIRAADASFQTHRRSMSSRVLRRAHTRGNLRRKAGFFWDGFWLSELTWKCWRRSRQQLIWTTS